MFGPDFPIFKKIRFELNLIFSLTINYKVPSVSMMKNFGAMKDIRAAHTNSMMEDLMSN